MSKIIFITGVSGVGKTTVIDHLKPLLDRGYETHDFDERGVPDNVDGQWRIDETNYWLNLEKENSLSEVTTIICGLSRPSEVCNEEGVKFILLDANHETIKSRLNKRYQVPGSVEGLEKIVAKPLEQFIDESVNFSSVLRKEAGDSGAYIIDTSDLSPEQVATKILDTIKS